jgi:hypothetical protein
MVIDVKKFKSLKRKVLKKYPSAKTEMTTDGRFTISNGNGGSIGLEFMIPPQDSVSMAWFWAAECVRYKQNINRTHPIRSAMSFNEKKFNRVSRRNRRK